MEYQSWFSQRAFHKFNLRGRYGSGVALMQLAEALIRLPPEARGMPGQLVRDKLATGDLDFFSHVRSDKSVLINGASMALSTVQRVLRGAGAGDHPASNPLSAAVSASGLLEAGIKRGLGILGRKFTLGPDIETAARRAVRAEARRAHTSHSFDMLGEGARTEGDARRYLRNYVDAARYLAVAPNVVGRCSHVELCSTCSL